MIRFAKYTFTGVDDSMGFKHGRCYNLAVHELSWFERLFSSYPASWKIIAFRPFETGSPIVPYSSWEAFYSNWHKHEAQPAKKSKQSYTKPLIPAH